MFVLHEKVGYLKEEEEAIVFKTVEDICTKFTDKYRLPLPIPPQLFFHGASTRTVIPGTLYATFAQSLPTSFSAPPETKQNNRNDQCE